MTLGFPIGGCFSALATSMALPCICTFSGALAEIASCMAMLRVSPGSMPPSI